MTAASDTLSVVEFHEGCRNMHCQRCTDADVALWEFLNSELGSDRTDLYYTWLERNCIKPNAPNGWWSKEALRLETAQRFVDERKGVKS